MAKKTGAPPSELLAAAQVLDAELSHFEHLARALDKEPLGSQKSIERAAESLQAITAAEEKLGQAVRALLAAINAAGGRQLELAGGVQRRALEIQRRTEHFRQLIEAFAALGSRSSELQARLTAIGEGDRDRGAIAVELDSILEVIVELTRAAEELGVRSKDAGFEDLVRQAEQTRVQLVATRGRFVQLQKQLVK